MGKLLVVACLFASACAMYGDPAPRVKNPPRSRPPVGWNDPDPHPIPDRYVEDCQVDFRAPPTTKRQTKSSQDKMIAGDSTTDELKSAKTLDEQVKLLTRAIEQYRNALIDDPYNAQATLKLALAYDKVLHKGCAIAMLKRLDQLSANPKFGADAVKGQLMDNEQWFKPYRVDALKAAGL